MKDTLTKVWQIGFTVAEEEEVRRVLNSMVNSALAASEDARNLAIKGDFLDAATALSIAISYRDMYMKIIKKMGHLLPDFEEITISFKNSFKYDVDRIKDAIG